MSPHRTPGERDERPDVEPLHKGPRKACPACGATTTARCDHCQADTPLAPFSPPGRCAKVTCQEKLRTVVRVTLPSACYPDARVRVSWLRRCRVPGDHLHQRCLACHAGWICATVEWVW